MYIFYLTNCVREKEEGSNQSGLLGTFRETFTKPLRYMSPRSAANGRERTKKGSEYTDRVQRSGERKQKQTQSYGKNVIKVKNTK